MAMATASEKAATDTPTLYSYWKTIHNTCEQYIKLSMDNIGTDTIYHPYGFVHFLAMSVRIAYDLFSFLSRDADGNSWTWLESMKMTYLKLSRSLSVSE